MNTEIKNSMKIHCRMFGLNFSITKTVLPGNQKGISASQTSTSNVVKISILLTVNYFIQQNKGDVVSLTHKAQQTILLSQPSIWGCFYNQSPACTQYSSNIEESECKNSS